jgi:hypothetical protein
MERSGIRGVMEHPQHETSLVILNEVNDLGRGLAVNLSPSNSELRRG